MAGYDFLMAADSLLTDDLSLNLDNQLIRKLKELDCVTSKDEFESKWVAWGKGRFAK